MMDEWQLYWKEKRQHFCTYSLDLIFSLALILVREKKIVKIYCHIFKVLNVD